MIYRTSSAHLEADEVLRRAARGEGVGDRGGVFVVPVERASLGNGGKRETARREGEREGGEA